MQTTKKTIVTKVDSWLSSHAEALISYAKTDEAFASSLAFHIQQRNWSHLSKEGSEIKTKHLTPNHQSVAVRNAQWLLSTLDKDTTNSQTKGVLNTWAQDYESPKDLVIGIVGVAVIGPTLGILNSKKKRRSHLQIIIDEKYYKTLSKPALAKLAQQISMDVVAKEIKLAGGNVINLHPDTADWCLSEPATKIYASSGEEITNLIKLTESDKLSHSIIRNEKDQAIGVAISPSVNDTLADEAEVELL